MKVEAVPVIDIAPFIDGGHAALGGTATSVC